MKNGLIIFSICILFCLCLITLTGCTSIPANSTAEQLLEEYYNKESITKRFEIIYLNSSGLNFDILIDKQTNLLYFVSDKGIVTPVLDEQGKPMKYTEATTD